MRKYIGIIFIILNIFAYGEIKIKIIEPLKFQNVNTTHLSKAKVLGVGTVEIRTDNKEEDIGSKIVLNFPIEATLTNRKRWVKVEKIGIEKLKKNSKENEFILKNEVQEIKLYAIFDRRELNKTGTVEENEGEYVGYIPIIVSQYKKLQREIGGEKDE